MISDLSNFIQNNKRLLVAVVRGKDYQQLHLATSKDDKKGGNSLAASSSLMPLTVSSRHFDDDDNNDNDGEDENFVDGDMI